MFIQLSEIFDIILMTLVVGYVFMDVFKPRHTYKTDDALDKYLKKGGSRFDWQAFWFAAMVTAPALILHELGHKVVALSFGLTAVFHAAYLWLAIAVILKIVNFPFIFFVPAYVAIAGATTSQHTLIAFAGPAVNLIMFIVAFIVMKSSKHMNARKLQFWQMTKNISLFLFIFNMIPIPGFDGFSVFKGLWMMLGL